MSVRIQGMGWVTPLGVELEGVWQRVLAGEQAEIRALENPESGRRHFYMPAPPKLVETLGRNPRLRRSSAISYFAAAAGLAALENAGVAMSPEAAERTAVIFAIASGGVIYTRKFYDQIARQGANAASPLLFPETVYNAPASHLAALLGINGMSYTLVGDASVGIAALKCAEQLLSTSDVDRCVVVGAEEVDWVLAEAYRAWRLTSAAPRIEIGANSGTLLAEGAAALVLTRESGAVALRGIHEGAPFFTRSQARGAARKALRELAEKCGATDVVVSCANGTFIDGAEAGALAESFPKARVLHPKRSLGEALGAGALMQTVAAALELRRGAAKRALVSSLGWNQQAGGAILE